MKLISSLLFGFMATAFPFQEASDIEYQQQWRSANRELLAKLDSARDRQDLPEDTVEFFCKGQRRLRFSLRSDSVWHGRYVARGGWTPDSKFFVFATFSSGAHSVWNVMTFAYSAEANSVVSIDGATHPVTSTEFKIVPPHILEIETLNPKGIDFPSVKVSLDLTTLFGRQEAGNTSRQAPTTK